MTWKSAIRKRSVQNTCSLMEATFATRRSTCRSLRETTAGMNWASTFRTRSFISDHFRWLVGGRVDKFTVLDNAVPRKRSRRLDDH